MHKVKLKEILQVTRGMSLLGKYYSATGKYIRLTLGNFNYPNMGFKLNTAKENIYYTGNVKPEYILKKNDIITPLTEQVKGLLGETAFIPADNLFIQSGDIALVQPIQNKSDANYIYYLISSKMIKNQLMTSSQQTKIRHTSPKYIKNCYAFIPNLDEQKKIGALLRKVDELILLNNKTNSELEQMVKTLYNYWFVQFDFPDENGRPYKSSGGKMVWNEELKKEIPEGWEVENLANNSISSIIPVGIEYFNKKNYLETKNINNELISDGAWISYDNRENRANMQPELNSIWFAKMKKSIKHITLPNNSKWFIDKYILSTGFFGIKCIYDAFSYIHCFINSDYFEAKKDILAHGATQKAVNNQDLERIPLIIPPTNLLKVFNSKIYNLLEMKLNMIKTNQKLTSLREFLLPLLMNGQALIKE